MKAPAIADRGFALLRVITKVALCRNCSATINPRKDIPMNDNANDNPSDAMRIPASLQRRKKQPAKMVGLRIPLSWWEELAALGREYDQDVSTFLREAIEDWLRRARKIRDASASAPKPPSPGMPF